MHQPSVKTYYQGKSSNNKSGDVISCSFCSSNHKTTKCPTYSSKTTQQRRELIIEHRLCFNCLKPHRSSVCRSTNRCLKCARKHHTSIHENSSHTDTSSKDPTKTNDPAVSKSTTATRTDAQVLHASSEQESHSSCILLATALVNIISPKGKTSNARILIDQGSEITLISERLVQHLHLPRKQSTVQLVGIGCQKSNVTNGITSCNLKSLTGSQFECSITAHILPKLTSVLPSVYIEKQQWSHLNGLTLADPNFLTRSSIDMILGADVYSRIIEKELIKGPEGAPSLNLQNSDGSFQVRQNLYHPTHQAVSLKFIILLGMMIFTTYYKSSGN